MFAFLKKKKIEDKNEDKKDIKCVELGKGFYLEYRSERNGYGGYYPASIVLKNHKKKKFYKEITNSEGIFLNSPGTKSGGWQNDVDEYFLNKVRFTFAVSDYKGWLCQVEWEVQPDGRYFADEDGYGAEDCSEIILYSLMNTKGEFICPFTDKRKRGFESKRHLLN